MNILQHIFQYSLHQVQGVSPKRAGLPFPDYVFNNESVAGFVEPALYDHYNTLRNALLEDRRSIKVTDFGAGDKEVFERPIASIAKKSSQKLRYNRLQFQIIRHIAPKTILEMGTSLGLSTALFAMAAPNARIITMEGCPNTAALAGSLFEKLGLQNVELIQGEFDKNLEGVLKDLGKADYIFFDGNHRMVPTLNYFLKGISYSHHESVFVFDDIRWSDQMVEAWKEINKHPSITLSLDMYQLGVLMFNPDLPKRSLKIKY
jgi:predicted O-methyltransferase YrrM